MLLQRFSPKFEEVREHCTADFRIIIISHYREFNLENSELHLEVQIWDLPDLMIAVVNYCYLCQILSETKAEIN